jgi:hypothetical protein
VTAHFRVGSLWRCHAPTVHATGACHGGHINPGGVGTRGPFAAESTGWRSNHASVSMCDPSWNDLWHGRQGRVVLIIGPRSYGKQILVDVVRLDVRPVLDDLWHGRRRRQLIACSRRLVIPVLRASPSCPDRAKPRNAHRARSSQVRLHRVRRGIRGAASAGAGRFFLITGRRGGRGSFHNSPPP